MIICKVIGHVWATKKEPNLEGLKLMVVQEDEPKTDKTYVAADVVGAGVRQRRHSGGHGHRRHHRQR